jgi:hypothetical protein
MTLPTRIAFSGRAGAGKDLAADYLLSKYHGQRLAFADQLKHGFRAMVETFGLPYEKDREALQFLGMWARGKNPQVFIDPVTSKIADNPSDTVLITDLRFDNEAAELRALGFVLVKVERQLHQLAEPTGLWRAHPSETFPDTYQDFDYVVHNCGTPDHYFGQLDQLWQMITEGAHKLINFRTVHIK